MPDSQGDAIIRDVLRAFAAARDPRLTGRGSTSPRSMDRNDAPTPPHSGNA